MKNTLFRFLMVMVIPVFCAGCATTPQKPKIDFESQIVSLKENMAVKEGEIVSLNEKIKQLEEQIVQIDKESKQKDVKIDYLKNKLKGFGVFE